MARNKSDRLNDTRIEELKRCCHQSMALGGSPPCVDIEETLKLLHEVQESRQILDPVRAMIGEEASSVTLVADNPEFHGVDSCVFVLNNKTGWSEVRVVGSSMADALLNAAARFGK